ncbi:4069_t:CDS:2, partial [Funneliformis caledonium]
PAMKLKKQAKIFREKSKAFEKSKIEYFGSFCVEYDLFSISYSDQLIFSQKIHEVVRNLLLKKKELSHMVVTSTNTSNLQEEIIAKPAFSKLDSLVSSTPFAKKRSISKILDVFADILLRDDSSINILKILKTAVCDFDQGIIALGSFYSYKSSNHLYVNSEHYIKVSKKSTYNAEIYQVLVNWLRKIYGYEITGQWHLKQYFFKQTRDLLVTILREPNQFLLDMMQSAI